MINKVSPAKRAELARGESVSNSTLLLMLQVYHHRDISVIPRKFSFFLLQLSAGRKEEKQQEDEAFNL